MIVAVLLLILGFIILVKGADFLLDGATSLAKKMSVSEIAIGLTVVAFGTSSPELVVNLISSLKGHHELCFGNVIGSNLFNILMVLGFAGMIYPITVQKNTVRKEIPFLLLGTVLAFALVNNFWFSGNHLSRIDGLIMLAFLVLFFIYVIGIAKVQGPDQYNIIVFTNFKTGLFIALGIIGLYIGGELVVKNAVKIALMLNVGQKLVALTMVALGTSLPEFVTSVIAVSKKRYDLAIGNIIGSNIFNLFMVLGVTALISPLEYPLILNIDFLFLIVISAIFLITMFTGKRRQLDRWEAGLFLVLYMIYLVFIIYRR